MANPNANMFWATATMGPRDRMQTEPAYGAAWTAARNYMGGPDTSAQDQPPAQPAAPQAVQSPAPTQPHQGMQNFLQHMLQRVQSQWAQGGMPQWEGANWEGAMGNITKYMQYQRQRRMRGAGQGAAVNPAAGAPVTALPVTGY